MKKLLIPAIALVTALSAGPALAHEGHMDAMWHKLGLAADQKKQLEDLHKKQGPEMAEGKKALMKEVHTMADLFADPSATDAQLQTEYDKLQKAADADMKLYYQHLMAMRAIMTPEQRKKFAGMARHWIHMRHMGMGMMGGHPGMMGDHHEHED